MPRYFFNIFDGVDVFDTQGTELANVREVRLYMLTTATEVLEREENQKDTWQMEALDEKGKIVGTMEFGLAEERES